MTSCVTPNHMHLEDCEKKQVWECRDDGCPVGAAAMAKACAPEGKVCEEPQPSMLSSLHCSNGRWTWRLIYPPSAPEHR